MRTTLFAFGSNSPDFLASVPKDERNSRVVLDTDLCVVDECSFFIRGCLDVPICDADGVFRWLVWVSLSKDNFNRVLDLWETPGREKEAPYFGWLNTVIPAYPETVSLKTNLHTRPVGERPDVELERTDHPLAIDQVKGITIARAQALAKIVTSEWA